jgi:hypothetical protein
MAPNYGPKIVTDGLTLCLDAANPKSYPGTGSTWFDLSKNKINGAIIGSPTFSNNYFDITGDTTYISIPNATLKPRTNDFTYSTWVNFDSTDNLDTIFENGSWGDTLLFRFQTNLFTVYAEGSLRGSLSWTPVTGSWVNLVLRRTAGTVDLKVNNVSTGTPFTMTTDINLSNPNLFLMRSQHTTGQFTNGKISFFSIYNRGLSDSEIFQNYQSYRGRYGL